MRLSIRKAIALVVAIGCIGVAGTVGVTPVLADTTTTVNIPTDTRQDATELSFGSAKEDALASSDAENWYTFTTTQDGYIDLTFRRDVLADSDYYWKVDLYRMVEGTGSAVKLSSYGFDANHEEDSIGEVGVSAGEYYVKVVGVSTEAEGTIYSIVADYTPADDYEKESNDTFKDATVLEDLSQTYTGRSSFVGDEDWYRFDVSESGYVQLDFGHEYVQNDTTVAWNVTLYRYDNGLNKLENFKVKLDSEHVYAATLGVYEGTYYIQVTPKTYTKSGSTYNYNYRDYTINLGYAQNDYWEREDLSDSYTSATPITLNETYSGSTFIHTSADSSSSTRTDVDYYTFTLDSDTDVSIDFFHNSILENKTDKKWAITLYRFDNSLQTVGSTVYSACNVQNTEVLPTTTLEAGTYYVRVANNGDNWYNATYRLTVSGDVGDDPYAGYHWDVNGDGVENGLDLLALKKHTLGLV